MCPQLRDSAEAALRGGGNRLRSSSSRPGRPPPASRAPTPSSSNSGAVDTFQLSSRRQLVFPDHEWRLRSCRSFRARDPSRGYLPDLLGHAGVEARQVAGHHRDDLLVGECHVARIWTSCSWTLRRSRSLWCRFEVSIPAHLERRVDAGRLVTPSPRCGDRYVVQRPVVQVGAVAEVGRQVLVKAGQVAAVDSGGGGVVGRRVERPGPDHVMMISAEPGMRTPLYSSLPDPGGFLQKFSISIRSFLRRGIRRPGR